MFRRVFHRIRMMSGNTPLLNCLADYAEYYAQRDSEKIAVVFGQERISYKSLYEQVRICARALLAMGVKKGDRVAMMCTPRTEFWILFLACNRMGAIWVGLNPKYQQDELLYLTLDCQPSLLFTLLESEGRNYSQERRAMVAANATIRGVVSIGGGVSDARTWSEFLACGAETNDTEYQLARQAVTPSDVALIVYTSGTTGRPKGAMITHYGLCFGATMQMAHFRVHSPVIVINFPINHVACVADNAATILVHGGKIIFQEHFDPVAVLQAIDTEACTIWGGVPTMFQLLVDHPKYPQADLSSVEIIIWGGAALPVNLINKLRQVTPRLMAVYGMTETSANVTFTDEDADANALAGTIGKPDYRCKCRILGKDGELARPNQEGEMQFKAAFLMKGYWNRPGATRNAFTEDGWLKTGDIGVWLQDGNIKLVGRLSEMYKSGGFNVYPREIEMVLEEIPGVAMAAVIDISDDVFQEVGHAYVQLTPGHQLCSDDLRQRCQTRLANYKIPKAFFVRNSLPMLPVGKVDKQALKQRYTSEQ